MHSYFSMFSGIGGFELGIQKVFPDAKCVGFSEIDKAAIQIYEKQFKGHKNYGDATRIIPEEIPDIDFLCGGFPCQTFSMAGKRGGFKDTRGTLFFEIARVLSAKRPELLLLENVKGLLSHDSGRTIGTIFSTLSELGYICQWQVLNSKNFGIPQNRERVFIMGHLAETSRPKVFPFIQSDQEIKKYNDIFETTPTERIVCVDDQCSESFMSFSDGVSPTLIRRSQGYALPYQLRRLSPNECERLQGFPDGWTEGIPESNRYKCLGNAVTVNVIHSIIKRAYNGRG